MTDSKILYKIPKHYSVKTILDIKARLWYHY